MKNKENILGTENIKKLMFKFSVPAVISMLVNSLYNVVDQIFIGHGVGYLGNGATSIIFPITMTCMAISNMFADGSASFLSLKLGEKKKDEAAQGVFSALISSVVVAILMFIIVFAFLSPIVDLFGCTEAIKPYALSYGRYIAIGLPFMMLGTVLNSVIRADGSPRYSMVSMVSGAVLNCILDPIFIFVFNWGVAGAAIATVISQAVTFFINLMYIRKFKTINLKDGKFNFNYVKKVCALGISSFVTLMSIVAIVACENNVLSSLGASSKYGADIPITVLGIVMKISQILNSIILGLAVGSQPIIGYNYGAGKYDRVKSTLKYVLICSTVVSVTAFILFQSIPDVLISFFGSSNDPRYTEFACMAFRIYLMLTICNGIQTPSGIFFQSIGKSKKSAILSLSRQFVILIPAMIIFGKLFGINGVLYSGPFADGCAFILSVIFLIFEVKKLKVNEESSQASIVPASNDDKHFVITIGREYGSGGRFVGELLAKELGIKCYDKNLIEEISYESGYSRKYIQENEQKTLDSHSNGNMSTSDELFLTESNVIRDIAKRESCVIVGRCGNFVLKDNKDAFHVFIYSDDEHKVDRAVKYYGLKKKTALKEINKINKQRGKHFENYTDMKWMDSSNYDMCINSDILGVEETAKLISQVVLKQKEN